MRISSILILILFLCLPALAQAADSQVEATTAISLPVDSVTIYPDGLVFVRRAGDMEVTEGLHDFVIDLPSGASEETVLFLVTNATVKQVVYESLPLYTMNFLTTGPQYFMLSYLMYDAGAWSPRYYLHLLNDSMIVSANAIVRRDLGDDLKDVRLKLVAGPSQEIMKEYAYAEAAPAMAARAPAEPQFEADFMPSSSGRTTGELETLFVFELENRTDLKDGKTLGLPLFEEEVPMKRVYTWDAYFDEEGPMIQELRLNNTGKLPWPQGGALLYRDGDYVTKLDISYTPAGANASLEVGKSSDLEVSKTLTDYNITEKIVALDDNLTRNVKVTTENWTYTLKVKSNTDRTVEVEVSDSRPMESELIAVSPEPSEVEATSLKWELSLEPRKEVKIEYTYRVESTERLDVQN
ncbi:MAG: DUF4139 domain-containing protein [Methanosarcinales archaeon]|nr:DUF4139 domain-containing protein [Methanosarcinales archaeon]